MHNKLSKVVSKSKGNGKQKAVPVRIVNDGPQPSTGMDRRGIDKYEAQDALRTLQRAAEIQTNKPLLRAAQKEAASQLKALSAVCKK